MQILIADESPISRLFIREELSVGGYQVLEASSGAEALQLFQERAPALVTLSVQLPDRSGFKVCESIRALERISNDQREVESRVPVIFVTAQDTLRDRELGFAAGASNFVAKPFAEGELLHAVNTILAPKAFWHDLQALVAEDSELTRHIVTGALHRLGVGVIGAADGQQALDLARKNARRISLIVSDLKMPLLDGEQLCRKVRAIPELRDVPFIALSAASEREAILSLFRAGATDFLIKPFSLEELLARIRVHVDACLLARDLARREEELRADLQLARAVQQAALHDRVQLPGLRRAVCSLPQSEVSGDVYDVSVSGGGALNVFLGDATGHGIGAAFMTMMIATGLDSIGPDQPLEDTLQRLHHLIHERAGERFVTGLYARLLPDGTLEHTSAGHPPMMLVPASGPARLLAGEGGMPLGLLASPLPFPLQREQLAPGDRLFLYTDGLTEWSRPDGMQFSIERALLYLTEHRGESIEACVEGVVAAARRFAQECPPDDDVTVLGLERAR